MNIGKWGNPYNTYLNFTGQRKKEIHILPSLTPFRLVNIIFQKRCSYIFKTFAFLLSFFSFYIQNIACGLYSDYPSQKKKKQWGKKKNSKFKLSSEHIRSHLHLVPKTSWLVTSVPALQCHTATSWYSLTVRLSLFSTKNYKRLCRAFLSKLKLTSHLWMRIKAAYSTAMA